MRNVNAEKNRTFRIHSIGAKADAVAQEVMKSCNLTPTGIFEENPIGQFKVTTYVINGEPEENVNASKTIKWIVWNYFKNFQVCYRGGDWMKLVIMDNF